MPVHTQILDNIHALLDFNKVSKTKNERVQYFANLFNLPLTQSKQVLEGEQVPNKLLLREIANKFEVDALWLLKN